MFLYVLNRSLGNLDGVLEVHRHCHRHFAGWAVCMFVGHLTQVPEHKVKFLPLEYKYLWAHTAAGFLPEQEPHQSFYINLGEEIFLLAQRTPSWGIPLGDKHLYCTQNWWRTALKFSHCWLTVHVHQFLLTCHYLVRFYCQCMGW